MIINSNQSFIPEPAKLEIANRIIELVQIGFSLEIPDNRNLLIGISSKGILFKIGGRNQLVRGFFYIEELDRQHYKLLLEEARTHSIEPPYQVYGKLEIYQSPHVQFVNIQQQRWEMYQAASNEGSTAPG